MILFKLSGARLTEVQHGAVFTDKKNISSILFGSRAKLPDSPPATLQKQEEENFPSSFAQMMADLRGNMCT
jgi:hypothetical protein